MAEKVVVTKSKLDALAAELRTLIGFTGNKTLDALTEEVAHYDPRPDISDATATAAQILSPYTAYINGGKATGTMQSLNAQTYTPSANQQIIPAGKYLAGAQTIKAAPLQNKTVTPSKTQQSVKADAAYYGLDTVTVKAAPLQAKTVAPTTDEQTLTPDAGYIGFSEVTVQAMPQAKKVIITTAKPYNATSFRIANSAGMSSVTSITIFTEDNSGFETTDPNSMKAAMAAWEAVNESTFVVLKYSDWLVGSATSTPTIGVQADFISMSWVDFHTEKTYTVIITGA